ncbi:MAG: imidazolonepropionase [Bacteroidetes bacterium]|nr:imidazolonepropionase [Bacteroidota bacterium]
MATTVITNIKQLVNTRKENRMLRGKELADLPCIDNAYLIIEDGVIAEFGEMQELKANINHRATAIDGSGQFVLPAWCDSHTHLVFSGSREEEFVDKIKGLSYAEINAKGGGILNSTKKLNATSEDVLFNLAWKRLEEISLLGTGAVEIKSGYGLTLDGELKMLRVIKRLRGKSNLTIKSTFLAAHSYPVEYRENHPGYIDLIIHKMLPTIAAEKLADYIDVFCEKGFFNVEEMETICKAGMSYGLKPKLHVNQLNSIGGIQSGIRMNALSLDHLETMTEDDITALSQSETIGTLLPTAAFFLRMPFQPARQLIDAGCVVALASDYNPGSSPSGNMNFVVALSCIQLKMLPEEAINAATLNGAYALQLEKELGSISVGKKANLIFTKKIPSAASLPYNFGTNLIDKVMIGGEFLS